MILFLRYFLVAILVFIIAADNELFAKKKATSKTKSDSKSIEEKLKSLEERAKQLEDDNIKLLEDIETQKVLGSISSDGKSNDEVKDEGQKKSDPFLQHPEGFEPKLEITGFAEWQFYHMQYSEGENYLWKEIAGSPKKSYFFIDANTYFKWHFHPWFSFFTEIKWLFADDNRTMYYNTIWKETTNPLTGEKISIPARIYEQSDFNLGAATARSHASHALFIERMHIDIHPTDYFKVKLGKFLTPFGIWNVDHGAPTLPTINLPSMFGLFRLVPYDQTGIEISGIIPIKSSNFGYSVYVGNGQNNRDEQLNLDHNFSTGARVFISTRKLFSLIDLTYGLSGYTGQATFIDQQILVYKNPSADAAVDVFDPHYATYTENSFKYDGATDIRLKVFNLEIIGELFYSYVKDNTYIGDPNKPDQSWGKIPNHHWLSYYVYAGWTFFDFATLYGRYDFGKQINNDYIKYVYNSSKYKEYVGGIRLRPYPFLVWKFETSYRPKFDDFYLGDTTIYATSISVAF